MPPCSVARARADLARTSPSRPAAARCLPPGADVHKHWNARVGAVIVEPVQGEGGFYVMPPRYLQGLRELCTQHGMLLILDEVQSGFGRTGKWAAYEHYGVIPDIATWAKSMGSGIPIAAVMGTGLFSLVLALSIASVPSNRLAYFPPPPLNEYSLTRSAFVWALLLI